MEDVVDGIIADVRARGDEALKEYALKFDGAKLDNIQVTQEEIEEAFANMDGYFLETLREAAANIEAFHRQQVHKNFVMNDKPGIVPGQSRTARCRRRQRKPLKRRGRKRLFRHCLRAAIL